MVATRLNKALLLVAFLVAMITTAFAEMRETNHMQYIWDGTSWKVQGHIKQNEKTPVFKRETWYYYDRQGRLDSFSVVETPSEKAYNGNAEKE